MSAGLERQCIVVGIPASAVKPRCCEWFAVEQTEFMCRILTMKATLIGRIGDVRKSAQSAKVAPRLQQTILAKAALKTNFAEHLASSRQ